MAQKMDENELVTFKEMLSANSKMVDALAQLLFEKRVFTEEEFYAKLKDVDGQYKAGKRVGS
jgi:hypothetical protein